MDYLDTPEKFVSTIKTFEVDEDKLTELKKAGVNPLAEIGLMKESKNNITLEPGVSEASINGETFKLSQPAQVIKGKTMVPLRFISESLGATVEWDKENQKIQITNW